MLGPQIRISKTCLALMGLLFTASCGLDTAAEESQTTNRETELSVFSSLGCPVGTTGMTRDGFDYCVALKKTVSLPPDCSPKGVFQPPPLICPQGSSLVRRRLGFSVKTYAVCEGKAYPYPLLPRPAKEVCVGLAKVFNVSWYVVAQVKKAVAPLSGRIETVRVPAHGYLQNGNGVRAPAGDDDPRWGNGIHLNIIGSAGVFGNAQGRVTINGIELEVFRAFADGQWENQWFGNRIQVRLQPKYADGVLPQPHNAIELSSGVLMVERADGRRVTGPYIYLANGANDVDQQYDAHIDDYAAANGKGANWRTFMKDDRENVNPFIAGAQYAYSNRLRALHGFVMSAIERKKIKIAYKLAPGAILCGQPWPGATVTEQRNNHMRTLKQSMENQFVGYEFKFTYNGNSDQSDITIWAHGRADHSHLSRGGNPNFPERGAPYLYLRNDAILGHEFAHYLGLMHHYRDEVNVSDIGDGHRMPPGEDRCLMDRNHGGFCSACTAALRIPSAAYTPAVLAEGDRLLRELLDHRHDECAGN
jgi:hypothetical protein